MSWELSQGVFYESVAWHSSRFPCNTSHWKKQMAYGQCPITGRSLGQNVGLGGLGMTNLKSGDYHRPTARVRYWNSFADPTIGFKRSLPCTVKLHKVWNTWYTWYISVHLWFQNCIMSINFSGWVFKGSLQVTGWVSPFPQCGNGMVSSRNRRVFFDQYPEEVHDVIDKKVPSIFTLDCLQHDIESEWT